jgi:hypothetical protein
VDERSRVVAASPADAWAALRGSRPGAGGGPAWRWVARLLGCEPASGFAVADEVAPERLTLEGRHRFARYRLGFELEPVTAGTLVRARTWAEFPGRAGRAYRLAVIGSRGHVVAVEGMLRGVQQRAERRAQGTMPGLKP